MSENKTWVKYDKLSDQHGQFIMQPLMAGMGLTIGNTLRRVMLSLLSGAAVTSIVIEGVEHEFASIDDVAEDVLDIICNLKSIIFKLNVDKPCTVRIAYKGKGKVTAKDIQHDADVEIVNKDQFICETTKETNLNITINVERGVGYSASENHKRDDQDVNTITLDASFSPINRINYKVDKIRVGRSLDYDCLVMDVVTNGSVDTEYCVKEATAILLEHFNLFGQLNNRPLALMDQAQEKEVVKPSEASTNLTIEDLELSARSLNCLKKAGIESVTELVEKDMADLIKIKNFGKKSAEEINDKLKQYNLSLKGEKVEA
ncbi:MAG: DNA-directed RNA polymerase subunit alpha [bacterium]|nr:DNA-directed RNA polymerase subunit alpha [bacterium]